ncbi:MAG: hypothetical protein IJ920_04345 [Paludibacteraceae bacterium]|nr:hypothetical protein [Paludibacteraceae bacterium]
MAQTFNFETRQLAPFRHDWKRGGNICGTLWYIKERDGIYIIDDDSPYPTPSDNLTSEYCAAKGLPAALLAQGNALANPEFNFRACYQAYFKIAQLFFPDKPAFDVYTVLQDWKFTLEQAIPDGHDISRIFANLYMISVAGFIQEISNYYRVDSLVRRMNHNYYYTCRFKGSPRPKLIFSEMPNVADQTEAPLIYASGMNVSLSTMELQANGFIAAVFNLALYYYWQRRWSEFNFTDVETIEKILKAYNRQYPIIDMAMLHHLPVGLPDEVEDLCKAYMEAYLPIMEKVWKTKPTVQLDCIEGDNIYTYIYAHEASSPDTLTRSELYANLMPIQQQTLLAYNRRFLEWLVKNYPITPSSQHRVMQAMSKDMPPIQVTIQNDIKVTRANEQPKPVSKFKYILSDDQKEIKKIHDRIKLHLSKPSELRNELSDMQDEELISLPMDKPTEIIREVHRIWGDIAPKERSFVIAWVRRF